MHHEPDAGALLIPFAETAIPNLDRSVENCVYRGISRTIFHQVLPIDFLQRCPERVWRPLRRFQHLTLEDNGADLLAAYGNRRSIERRQKIYFFFPSVPGIPLLSSYEPVVLSPGKHVALNRVT
jgi:hypothetical protein